MIRENKITDSSVRPLQCMKYFGLHLALLLSGYIIYALATGHHVINDAYTFLNWDAYRYFSIKENGYFYLPNSMSTVAFFPAFPYLWKYLQLGVFGIMTLNLLLLFSSFMLIARYFEISAKSLFLYWSLPAIFFFYMPYSEALFFFTATLVLIGYKRENMALIMTGFFLCSLTRSAVNVFIPAIILVELCSDSVNKWRKISLYTLACLAGIFVVAWMQHAQTGEWLGFIKAQKQWGHQLQWPSFPLSSNPGMVFFDAAGLIIGGCAIVLVFCQLYKRIFKGVVIQDKVSFFSTLYVAGVTIVSLAFKGHSIYSLQRYVVPTVFFFFFLAGGKWQEKVNWKFILVFFLFVTLSWELFHAFHHIQTLLKYTIVTAYLSLLLLTYYKNSPLRILAFISIYIISLALQLYLLFLFMDCEWVA